MAPHKQSGTIKIMFTCAGRRVSLINSFRSAAKSLKIPIVVFGIDTTALSAAMQLCDKSFVVKPVKTDGYLTQILDIVKKEKIKLIIPTVDLDLKVLAENRSKFDKLGCCVLVSDPDVVEICQDKRITAQFLASNRFNTPETLSIQSALAKKKLTFPRFLKPWDGYASKGNFIARDRAELKFYARHLPHGIVQDFVNGLEYTCDVYVDFKMQVRCVVPRLRIETRSGEVSKGQVIKNRKMMMLAADVVTRLGGGPGVITIQCFLREDGEIVFTEINPRFGGGAPLSIKAGANFPKWILQELTGIQPRIKFDGYKDKLIMLRYDNEVWV